MKGKQGIARCWDDIQGTKYDYEARAAQLHNILTENRARRVLDIGCGTGSLLIQLARSGYRCMGLDVDAAMLAEARKKAESARLDIEFLQGDLRQLRLAGTFDGVTCFQVLSLLESPAEVKALLESVRNILAPQGILAFDVLGRDGEGPEPAGPFPLLTPPFIDAALEREDTKVVRLNRMTIDKSSQQWQAVYFFDEGEGVEMAVQETPLKAYTREEIEALLGESGFVIRSLGGHEAGGVKRRNLEFVASPDQAAAGGGAG
jgi:ubiquinone/menaquinone biosynthesis C-methylase UbiE